MSGVPTFPPVTTLVKIAGVLTRVEEELSGEGRQFDGLAIKSLLADKEIRDWITGMNGLGLVPLNPSRENSGLVTTPMAARPAAARRRT
jgi:hypothetical protein